MKKLFLIVAAMFAVVSFSACSDDDDNKDASIVGTWQITYYEGWATFSDGTRDDWSDAYPLTSEGNYYWTYTFNENGTCVQTDSTIQIIKTMIARPCISHILLMATHSQ